MCGIFGYISNSNEAVRRGLKPLIEQIGVDNVMRGSDANGYAYADPEKGTVVFKTQGSFRKTIERKNWADLAMPKVFIGHTRAATKGHPKDNGNNHPLTTGDYTIVHNGILWNDEELFRTKNLLRSAEVDSEVICSLIDRTWIGAPMADNKHVLKEALKQIRGSHACAMLDEKEPESLYLWRHLSPLYMAYLPKIKTLMFSSIESSLKRVLKGFDVYHGSLGDDQGVVISLGKTELFMEDFEFESSRTVNWEKMAGNAKLATFDDRGIYGYHG